MNDEPSLPEPGPAAAPPGLVRLSFNEARVLGCLLEKEATTPDLYPLTLNTLHSACNQSSNREPVTGLGTDEVEEATEGLRYKRLGILVHQAGARVPKYKHTLDQLFPYLDQGQRALLCVLLLRGQQTAGELRQRAERMHRFPDVESTESALQSLCENQPHPLARLLRAGGGRRVATYVHLFCGEPEEAPFLAPSAAPPAAAVAGPTWREEMEARMDGLSAELASLREEFRALKDELGA